MLIYLFYIVLILLTICLNIVGERLWKQHWNLWLGCGIPALVMMIFLWNVSQPTNIFSDFNKAYYPAGRLVLESPLNLYDKNCNGNVCFVNIPIIALLFTPISFLNLPTAQLVIVILSGLSIFITWYLLFKIIKIKGWQQIAILELFVINGPLYYSIRNGNSTHFVFLLLLAALLLLHKKQEFTAGLLLAIAALIKIPLFIFGVYFFIQRKWRALLGSISGTLAIVFSSVLLFGINLHLIWFRECIQAFGGKPLAAYNVQSLDSFLARLLTDDNLFNWNTLTLGWEFKLIKYLLFSVILGLIIWNYWKFKLPNTPEVESLEFSLFLCLSIIISPLSWTHYYLFFLLPLCLYLGKNLALNQDKLWISFMGIITILISLPVIRPQITNPKLGFLISKFLSSHYLLGGILLLGVLLTARWRIRKNYDLSQQEAKSQTS